MDNTYLHTSIVLLTISSKQAMFVAFLLPDMYEQKACGMPHYQQQYMPEYKQSLVI